MPFYMCCCDPAAPGVMHRVQSDENWKNFPLSTMNNPNSLSPLAPGATGSHHHLVSLVELFGSLFHLKRLNSPLCLSTLLLGSVTWAGLWCKHSTHLHLSTDSLWSGTNSITFGSLYAQTEMMFEAPEHTGLLYKLIRCWFEGALKMKSGVLGFMALWRFSPCAAGWVWLSGADSVWCFPGCSSTQCHSPTCQEHFRGCFPPK